MARLLPGESPDEAKRRIAAERGVAPPAQPAALAEPTPVPTTPTPRPEPTPPPEVAPTPSVDWREEAARRTERQAAKKVEYRQTEAMQRLREAEARHERERVFWETFQPWQPTDMAEAEAERKDFIGLLEGAGGVTRPKGQTEDVYDAYQNIFLVFKNMEALVAHTEEKDPEGFKDLARVSTGYTVNVATLNPQKAVIDALNSIAEEREDYTVFLGTEEGLTELFQRAAQGSLAAPGFREMTALAPGETAGEGIRGNLPASRLTEILATSAEIAGDPTFIAMIAVFPPAGLAAKGRLLAEISLGMAAGEEAAEAAGLPGVVGMLPGGVAVPTATRMLQGFTRAGRQMALESARHNPVSGQPATELLRERGLGPLGADNIRSAVGEEAFAPRALYRGTSTKFAKKPLREGTFLTPNKEHAEIYARTTARAEGGEPVVLTVEAVSGSTIPSEVPGIAAEAGARRVVNPRGIKVISEKAPPAEARPLPSPIKTLEGQAIFDTTERRLIKPNEIARDIREQADYFAMYGEGHEPYFAAQEVAERGLFGNIRGTYSEVPRLKIEGNTVRIRYDVDGYLRSPKRVSPLPAEQYQSDLRATINAVKKEWPEKGILIEDSNEFIPGKLISAKALPAKAPPAIAGGEDFWSIRLNDDMIRSAVERPEARDILRKVAEGLSHTVPGARKIVEIVNRMALMEEPHLKAALGWQLGRAWQEAQREVALAALRGKRVPFRENAIGQIWLPKAAGQARPRFGHGKGDWIAVGDVFEDVMRGGREYLPRLTEEQVSWIGEARGIMAPFTRETEAAMGIKVATREVHWPRFSLDPTAGRWLVHAGARGRARPPAMFQRIFEIQEEAISEFGIRYRPGVVTQMDLYIQGMQHMSRDAVMGQYLRREGIVRAGRRATQRETFVELLGPSVPKWTVAGPRREMINKELLTDIQTLIGPLSANPLITVPQKFNAVARLMLTGSLDTGVGAIQMTTLAFAFPDLWAESMARGLYAMIAEPKSIYRFISTSPAARRFAAYGGNVGLDSEFFEATRLVGQAIPRVPGVQPVLDVATYPVRLFIRRMQVGFEGPLLFGRVLAFDAMADAAGRAPSAALRAAGARQLEGKALHEELFRVARFTDTLLGQPKLGGIISTRQAQFESAWVWFATRYTRSILGTLSYMAGVGYTPAQARVVMAKMFVGGAAVLSALIAGRGAMQGKSQEEIIEEITTALNPMSGKKHMSMEIAKSWFGMGGAYRSGMVAFAGLFDKRNWKIDEWGDQTAGGAKLPRGLWDNPFLKPILGRTAPLTGTLSDFIEGEDFLGYRVALGDLVTDPRALLEYGVDNFAPITVDAFLQGHGTWLQRLPAAGAEFFGLRTSPETAWEALEPVRNRVSNAYYGMGYDKLENNRVARQRVNDHPDVVAVVEGRVRPIQDQRVQTAWDKYFEQSEGVRETYGTQKEELDEITRAGRMDGRTYCNEYGDIQLEEFGELTGLQKALGIAFEDVEPPEGSVDAALLAYYAVDLDGKDEDGNFIYHDPETGEYDWEAWYSDREDTLTGLSDTERADVEWYFRRHETELRRDFRKAFDEIIDPSGYLRTRETMAKAVGLDITVMKEFAAKQLQAAGQRAGAGDVWRLVDEALNSTLEARFGEGAPSLTDLRKFMREAAPRLDVELYRQGFVTTAQSEEAIVLAQELQQRHPERAYFPPRLAGDVEAESPKAPRRGPTPAQPVVAFLRAGRATHPDEQEVQDEYDLMIGAVETGKNLSEAKRLAQSHLDAHKNALRPEVQGTDRDPYPGEPEKNQAAVDGFTRVLALLANR